MVDNFQGERPELLSPAFNSFAITPADGANLSHVTRGLYVGVGGNISLFLAGDASSVVLLNVPTGVLLPLRVVIVNATNTTATNLIGLY